MTTQNLFLAVIQEYIRSILLIPSKKIIIIIVSIQYDIAVQVILDQAHVTLLVSLVRLPILSEGRKIRSTCFKQVHTREAISCSVVSLKES